MNSNNYNYDRKCEAFINNTKSSDFIFYSFPKSGRTWVRFFLAKYYSFKLNEPFDDLFKIFQESAPSNSLNLPKIFFTHMCNDIYSLSQISNNSKGSNDIFTDFIPFKSQIHNKKIILLLRNPFDQCLSYYYQIKNREGLISTNFNNFVLDKSYGFPTQIFIVHKFIDFFKKQKKEKLIFSYERLKSNPKKTFTLLLKFLNDDVDIASMKRAITDSSFDKMQEYEKKLSSKISNPGRLGHPEFIKNNDVSFLKVRSGVSFNILKNFSIFKTFSKANLIGKGLLLYIRIVKTILFHNFNNYFVFKVIKKSYLFVYRYFYNFFNLSFFQYFFSYIRYLFLYKKTHNKNTPKILIVVSNKSKGWILDRFGIEICKYNKNYKLFYYDGSYLPNAKNYYFTHYSIAASVLKNHSNSWRSRLYSFYTHPRNDLYISFLEYFFLFYKLNKIIFMNSQHLDFVRDKYLLNENKLKYIVGGYDSSIFINDKKIIKSKIGFCSAFYDRKNPALIISLIKLRKDLDFVILGKDWHKYSKYNELKSLSNLTIYEELDYKIYPKIYASMKIFISTSFEEGGPIPLLEAMSCGALPVVSNKGFAVDVIKNGINGFLFDPNINKHELSKILDHALNFKLTYKQNLIQYNWKNYSHNLNKAINEKK